MHAYYRDSERQQHERAQLVIEDFSLLPGSPYGASSLIPPTRKPFELGKALGVAALAVALGTGAWFVQRETSIARSSAAHATPKVAVAAAVVHAPVATQPVVEARTKVEPVQSAPVAVAATPAVERAVAPAAEVPAASARKTMAATEVHESARPAIWRPRAKVNAMRRKRRCAPCWRVPRRSQPRRSRLAKRARRATRVAAAPVAASAADTTADAMGALPELPSREDVVDRLRERARRAVEMRRRQTRHGKDRYHHRQQRPCVARFDRR